MAARDAVLSLESSNCSNVPPVRIQQAPCSPAPARMAYNGLGRLGEPARRTAGALAQAAALHVAARTLAKYPSICIGRAYSTSARWQGRRDVLCSQRYGSQTAPSWAKTTLRGSKAWRRSIQSGTGGRSSQ